MKDEEKNDKRWHSRKDWHKPYSGPLGGIYGLAFIGAAVYYIQQADTFWIGVLGFLKAIVWPAMLIYKVFTLLKM